MLIVPLDCNVLIKYQEDKSIKINKTLPLSKVIRTKSLNLLKKLGLLYICSKMLFSVGGHFGFSPHMYVNLLYNCDGVKPSKKLGQLILDILVLHQSLTRINIFKSV